MSSYVVTLTGGKNNAGDFLIKYKAHALLKAVRPDLEVIDIDGWKVSESDLDIINGATILLLTGGPALIPNMIPAVYSLDKILDKITIPIATYGVGWFHSNGDWKDTTNIKFNAPTKLLFERIAENGVMNSVRDYFTCELLLSNGVKNTVMTGCPVTYNGGVIPSYSELEYSKKINVAVSIGVGFKDSRLLFKQIEELLMKADSLFGSVTAIFHHSLIKNKYVAGSLTQKQEKLLLFLKKKNINYIDISGSAEKLMDVYDTFDLHIGYRVHAHLYMLSQGKSSYLIAEDGRGTGQQQVLGEPNFRSYSYAINSKIIRGLHRIGVPIASKLIDKGFVNKYLNFVSNDLSTSRSKNRNSIEHMKTHFSTMKLYLSDLPK